MLDRASALVDDMEDLERRFQPTSSAISGRLCVDVPSRIARRIVAPALPDFLHLYPDITLELGSSDRMIDLVQEGVDCALRVGQLAPSSLVARPLGAFEIINCASPTYLARLGTPRTLNDLGRHSAIDFISATTKRAASWEWSDGAETRTLTLAVNAAIALQRPLLIKDEPGTGKPYLLRITQKTQSEARTVRADSSTVLIAGWVTRRSALINQNASRISLTSPMRCTS